MNEMIQMLGMVSLVVGGGIAWRSNQASGRLVEFAGYLLMAVGILILVGGRP